MRAVRAVVAFAALALLVGCGSASPPAEVPKLLTRAEADARTVVPFTRGVRLDKAGRIVDVTFDLPPAVPPAIPSLKIGFRLQAQHVKPLLAEAERIRDVGLPARVRLERLDGDRTTSVRLMTTAPGGRSMEPLPADGHAGKLVQGKVESGMLIEAGLYSQDVSYHMLQLADAGLLDPGRYHLTVDLLEDRPQLNDISAEFIVGFQLLGK
ncbi:hypothetical protein [Stenotrophomonas lactitubi]|uniref:hypothetical protein n=1 Tax=Stenotrophomonas lactitubi TaxID=2045214 RepID=UPI001DAEB2C2|nr:hypothetical protein [Stenotrophomonas lactitubi]CAH0246644.1 hypothetical protein SRABI122_03038 [Stenotrophomonas lactitubi]CAH0262947.1 hypothetical protein SRABI66_03504 [Stenotrophomonas lactitubi]CAH0264175.1 hypothetical protein SRABI81_03530 [Stenotrophomonas lactitubi]CAH0269986.1 hypothetical protein SRABI102_03526 [Stenotrophomonas lactitubi]